MADPQDDGGDHDPGREVVVPLPIYKTVTVYATLFAVLFVLLGFTFLDAATGRASVLLGLLVRLPVEVPTPAAGVTRAAFAFAGLVAILFGAWVYVLGARFRAEGMGTDKDEEHQSPDDG